MTRSVCMTVDVEDFYEGMAVLGERVERPARCESGLRGLLGDLQAQAGSPKITMFVVGGYAATVRSELQELVDAGHEVASHGPDHGRLPVRDLVRWLRTGREMLEDLFQVPVHGFRSPRFDVPDGGDLTGYREQLAEAGFSYVSDTAFVGDRSAVSELPVLSWHGLRLGGGSYQRMVPSALVRAVVATSSMPAVLYYHSYDFDRTLPGIAVVRSRALARQLVGRRRVESVFKRLTSRFGSDTCCRVASGIGSAA